MKCPDCGEEHGDDVAVEYHSVPLKLGSHFIVDDTTLQIGMAGNRADPVLDWHPAVAVTLQGRWSKHDEDMKVELIIPILQAQKFTAEMAATVFDILAHANELREQMPGGEEDGRERGS